MRRAGSAANVGRMAPTTTLLLESSAATARPAGCALLPNGTGLTFVGWLARGGDRLAWNLLQRRLAGADPIQRKKDRS